MKSPTCIIVGAIVVGVSTLHQLLSPHQDLYLPPLELFFFDIDQVEEHPVFVVHSSGEWVSLDFERNRKQHLEWSAPFDTDQEAATTCERSTTYIHSDGFDLDAASRTV